MAKQAFLAVDLGASSGRVLAGRFDGKRLGLDEIHRFENGAVSAAGGLYWDVLGLWREIKQGLRRAASEAGGQITSLGVDTWGVDFALLGPGDELLENPHTYRDPRSEGMLELACREVPREEIFAQTGLQFLSINTLYQLLALRERRSVLLETAKSLLMMPDLFHWLLTGAKVNEYTDASTTQFFNPKEHRWATELLERLRLPTGILQQIVEPGTRLGKLRREVADETGLAGAEVVLPGTHDTASAVMAVPAAGEPVTKPDWCYISSGTWSLVGVELSAPLLTPHCHDLGFTNEGGVGRSTRLLKNISGLWLVQECRRKWNEQGAKHGWEDLNRMSAEATPLASFVDPDDSRFMAQGDMPAMIREFCRETGQSVPETEGAVIRCALESLALKYRQTLAALEELTGGQIKTVHIVGGGTQNRQLCQATADACGRPVVAGPVEATAIGNVMMQAIAAGEVGSIAEARSVIASSFPVARYEPEGGAEWGAAYERYRKICNRGAC